MECAYSIWTSGSDIDKISQCAVRQDPSAVAAVSVD